MYRPSFVSTFDVWVDVSLYAVNAAQAMFEIVFTQMEALPLIDVVWPILALGLYFGLAFLVHSNQHFYVHSYTRYASLDDFSTAAAILTNVGIVFAIFALVSGVILLRERIVRRRLDNRVVYHTRWLKTISTWETASTVTLAQLCNHRKSSGTWQQQGRGTPAG